MKQSIVGLVLLAAVGLPPTAISRQWPEPTLSPTAPADAIDDVARKHHVDPALMRQWNDPSLKPPMTPRRREKGPILPANPAAFYQWGYHWYGYPYRPRPRLILHPTPGWGSAR
jgi:hypothetical protein